MKSTCLILIAGSALAQAPMAPRPRPLGHLKALMQAIPYPNSEVLFAVQDTAPRSEAEWMRVENAAVAIAETATLIAMPGRLRSDGKPAPVNAADWKKFTSDMGRAARECYKAAQARSVQAAVACTDGLALSCSNCHDVYRDRKLTR